MQHISCCGFVAIFLDFKYAPIYALRCVQGKEKFKMKRKTNKKSGIIAAVVGLSAVSLVSVGFASWVMSGGDSAAITDGQISVETVDDKRFLIMKTGDYAPRVDYGTNKHVISNDNNQPVYQQANSICFGIDDSTPISGAWLTAGGTEDEGNAPKYENLSATVIFYVANLTTVENVVTAELTVTGNTDGWDNAVGENYVAEAPTDLVPVIPTTGDNLTYTDPATHLVYRKVTAAIQFGWGSTFTYNNEVVNPYVYFNHQENTYANTTTAKTVLDNLETYLTGVTFSVAITTSVPGANSGN